MIQRKLLLVGYAPTNPHRNVVSIYIFKYIPGTILPKDNLADKRKRDKTRLQKDEDEIQGPHSFHGTKICGRKRSRQVQKWKESQLLRTKALQDPYSSLNPQRQSHCNQSLQRRLACTF